MSVWADRPLKASETESLLRQLTASPGRRWMESGTVTARHLEYHREGNSFLQSQETVAVDQGRYRWEIVIETEDAAALSAPAEAETKSRFGEDPSLNRQQIFCWDGKQLIRYYPKAEYAMISAAGLESEDLLGPLSAGVIPWGYGDWQIQKLLSRKIAASEVIQNGQTLIRLEIINPSISPTLHTNLLLDPSKDYAVLSFVMENEAATIESVYSDYLQSAGRWIPRKIRMESSLKTAQGRELISYEDWEFTDISAQKPSPERFRIPLQNGTLVEMHPGGDGKSFLYYASDRADIGGLLEEKLSLQSSSKEDRQNCAAAAIMLMAKRFSHPPAKDKAAALSSGVSGQTSLNEVKQTLEESGLYCLAVQTNLDQLRRLTGCAVIAHLPKLGHYVIVDRVEEESAWTIDLTSRKFYWKWKRADFEADWKEGTALLVSDSPSRLPSGLQTLAPARLNEIYGGEYETYSCSEKIQKERFIPCPEPRGGFLCGGACYLFQERYGCVEDEFGGVCIGVPMCGYLYTLCKNHPEIMGACTSSGWRINLIRACN